MSDKLKAPYPYFGGKSKVADLVWQRFGEVKNAVEPFFGSGAMLLSRPAPFDGNETVNDLDGMISNFWRSIRANPDETAYHADWPVNENDLHARHAWLVGQKETLQAKLEGDPDYFDAKIAGWWVWGMACWIGGGFCSGNGPWQVQVVDGVRKLVHLGDNGQGVNRKLVHLGNNGRGVNRKLVHLGDNGRGVNRKLVHLGDNGQGVNRQLVVLTGYAAKGVCARTDLAEYFSALSTRFARVRVCCGDWSRVCGPSVTFKHGLTAVFLDPPYADTANRSEVYTVDSMSVAYAVRDWAIEMGKRPDMRIALCGYEGEHQMPQNWECVAWKASGGYEGQSLDGRSGNCFKERIWFSPACLTAETQAKLEL
jgi:site-specific DNA-adenine methylase